jgi:hypothetical protein
MAGDRKKLFHLREYDAAFLKVFSRVIHLRAEEADPILWGWLLRVDSNHQPSG